MSDVSDEERKKALEKGGAKWDGSKVERPALIPPLTLRMLSMVYSGGAIKYKEWNWRKGLNFSRLWDAHDRHVNAAKMGEWFDEEFGLPHVVHAIWNLVSLNELYFVKPESNDMPDYKGCMEEIKEVMAEAIKKVGKLREKYALKEEDPLEDIHIRSSICGPKSSKGGGEENG